ncbi:MAG: hypothetical protein ACE5M4_15015 [Anaerolineales bacterium]
MFGKHLAPVTVAGMLMLVAVGCSESQNPIGQYGKEVIQAHERTQRVKARADMQVLKTAIQQYYTERGRFPESLTDVPLVQNQGIDTELYSYDPTTGNVNLR